MLKAQHESPERFLSHNHSYAPILLGSEMELLVKCMEFILSPFLNYDFILISFAFSRGGVREKRKKKERGREMCFTFKGFVVVCF